MANSAPSSSITAMTARNVQSTKLDFSGNARRAAAASEKPRLPLVNFICKNLDGYTLCV